MGILRSIVKTEWNKEYAGYEWNIYGNCYSCNNNNKDTIQGLLLSNKQHNRWMNNNSPGIYFRPLDK